MRVLFIDPGTLKSAWVRWDTDEGLDGCLSMGIEDNEVLLDMIANADDIDHLVIEDIQSYGMPVGREVFRTVLWSGRFVQVHHKSFELMPRREVKLQLCGTSRAKDSNVLCAVRDQMGYPPTKRVPNPRWPSKPVSHIWQAAGMALAWMMKEVEGNHGA